METFIISLRENLSDNKENTDSLIWSQWDFKTARLKDFYFQKFDQSNIDSFMNTFNIIHTLLYICKCTGMFMSLIQGDLFVQSDSFTQSDLFYMPFVKCIQPDNKLSTSLPFCSEWKWPWAFMHFALDQSYWGTHDIIWQHLYLEQQL